MHLGWWVLIVFLLQASLLFWISRQTPFRTTTHSNSTIQLVEGANLNLLQEIAHEDPELLSQPNPRGFSELWLNSNPLDHQLHRWSPPSIELSYPSNLITDLLEAALISNMPPQAVTFLKPPPKIHHMDVPSLQLRRSSWLEITGNLKNRQLENSVPLTSSWHLKDLLKPTIVQVMVNRDGLVFTGSLLDGSGHNIADKLALEIALKKVRFKRMTNAAPDTSLTTGNLIFHWHVNLNSVTNITKRTK
jgi:hypothetical protein|tara:strand:+ start:25 stop:765 length:741 start_codon:yes stop_codon:yes gene_type:complete